jgi:succinoglycan biosynthesis transport protein ExoP
MRTIPETDPPVRLGSGSGEGLANGHAGMTADYLSIRDYLGIIYRRRRMIVAILVLGFLSALARIWTLTPVFQASATLNIEGYANVLGVDRPLVDSRDWMKEFLPTQLGILESTDVALIAHQELQRLADAGKRPLPTVGEILATRTVTAVKDSHLVNVGFVSPDPVLAADVANALARAGVKVNLKTRTTSLDEASSWLGRQVEEQRERVHASEVALQRYREQHGAGELFADQAGEARQNVLVQRLAELQSAATRAKSESIEKEAQYKQLLAVQANHEPVDTLPAVAANGFIQGLKTELTSLQRQQVQASKELGERHPEMIKLQGAVQTAERKLQTEISNVVQGVRNDFEAAQARERALTIALEQQKAAVGVLNAKTIEYVALEREATSNREVLDKLLQRSREATLSSELQSTNIRIVDPARVPGLPIPLNKYRIIVVALGGSGALALTLVFLLEIFNTRVTSADDVKRHLRISVLGMLPQVKPEDGQPSLLGGDGVPAHFAELLNAVRTNLLLAPGLAAGRILLVTSSEPGEGKTVTAANLAVSLARLNQRVLLIDGDLRRPRLHEVFEVEQQPGLTDMLIGNRAEESAFQETKVAGLWVMPSGNISGNPTDLLGSERFTTLVDRLNGQFDWILLDSPPVLAVTDPCLIARAASGVLFVVGCGQTSREKASAALDRLEAVGANFVGAILNRVVLGRQDASYLPYYQQIYPTHTSEHKDRVAPPELPGVPSGIAVATPVSMARERTSELQPAVAARPRAALRVEAALRRSGSPVPEPLGPNPWDI